MTGPLGNAFVEPRQVSPGAAGAILVGGGIGVAPLALLRRRFCERGVPLRVLLGFRDQEHSGGLELFCGSGGDLCPEVRLACEDGHRGHRGYVTDLLAAMLAGDDAETAVVYSCGPPAMLEAVRALCADAGSPASWRWSRRWPAATAPASAAPCPSPAAATCASASTARSCRRAGRRGDPCLSSAESRWPTR